MIGIGKKLSENQLKAASDKLAEIKKRKNWPTYKPFDYREVKYASEIVSDPKIRKYLAKKYNIKE